MDKGGQFLLRTTRLFRNMKSFVLFQDNAHQ